MKGIVTIFIIAILTVVLPSCNKKKVPKASTSVQSPDQGVRPSSGAPDGEDRTADLNCDNLTPGSYIQGEKIDTIYLYALNNELISIKAFPNWYSYHVLSDPAMKHYIVPDSCIESLEAKAIANELQRLPDFPNQAKIKIDFNINDTGRAYINGSQVSSGSQRELKTGMFVAPYTVGKNVVAITSDNSSGFGGAVAHIKVNDCGNIGANGKCDGAGYDMYTEKPIQVNYTIPSNINGCFPLYVVEFNATSKWGMSRNPSSSWTSETNMNSFTKIPEGYPQGSNGAPTLSGHPEAHALSSGVNHPYCGPEGFDLGSYSGENGKLYYKTIIRCDYYYCWQDNADAVTGHLLVP